GEDRAEHVYQHRRALRADTREARGLLIVSDRVEVSTEVRLVQNEDDHGPRREKHEERYGNTEYRTLAEHGEARREPGDRKALGQHVADTVEDRHHRQRDDEGGDARRRDDDAVDEADHDSDHE